MSDNNTANLETNNRWWESYLVRYFSGSIVGAICTAFIYQFSVWRLGEFRQFQFLKEFKTLSSDSETIKIILFLAIGLVYAYLVSSPITVIHYGRAWRSNLEKHVRYMWIGWILTMLLFAFSFAFLNLTDLIGFSCIWVILILLSLYILSQKKTCIFQKTTLKIKTWNSCISLLKIIFFGILFFSSIMLLANFFELKNRPLIISLLSFSVPIFFIGMMQYITLLKILLSQKFLNRFYQRLVKARSMKNSKEIRETYSHLREHSNATFIVLLELCFTSLVICIIDIYSNNLSNATISNVEIKNLNATTLQIVLGLIAFWLLPNLFMWSRANQLEMDFKNKPRSYLTE